MSYNPTVKYSGKVISATLAALLFNFFPAAQAATPVVKARVLSVSVVGKEATVKWSAPKLPKGAFFEVEFSSVFPVSFTRILRSATTTVTNTLNPYTKYKVRVKSKAIAKGAWSNSKEFITSGDPVNNVNIVKTTHTTVEVAWEEDVAATGYEVTFNNGIPKRTNTPNFTFTGLKPGVVGQFSIRPISGIYKGEATPSFEFSTLTSGPTSLKSSQITTNSFLLEWIGVEGATSYNVYKNDVFLASSKSTSYAVKSLLPDVAADYSVEAVFSDVVTEASEKINVKTAQEILAVLATPVVSAITSVAANVNWTLAPKATTYTVTLYDSLGLTTVATKVISASITSAQFTSLAPLTGYSVGVVVNNGTNSSLQSPLAVFTTLKTEISGLITSNIMTTSITLGWTSISAATSYEVLRDGLVIASSIAPTTLSYGLSSLAPGVTYKLGVRATYLNGSNVTTTTELKEVSVATLIDTSYKPAINTNPVITLPYAANPIVGATLTSTTGIWTAVPAVSVYTYQWQRSADLSTPVWSDISGATSLNYVVTSLDVGQILRIRVTATNSNGTGTVFATQTTIGAVGYNTVAPIIRGNFVKGQLLEATDGTWVSPYSIVFSYQWRRDGVAIGATGISSNYTLVDADIGKAITVVVTATTAQGSLSVTTASRGTVLAVSNSTLPTISGTVRVGSTLTVSAGTWFNATTNTYQWQSSSDSSTWNAIVGASSTTYTLTSAESGLYIRTQVFGNYTSGSGTAVVYQTTANTAATVVVPASNVTNSVLPVISGNLLSGQTLTTTNGTWSTTGTFTYQWQSSLNTGSTWSNISSATSSTFVLTGSETGIVRVQVTNSISSGAISGTAFSVATVKIGAPYNTVLPVISGTLRIGSAQSVTTGTWGNTPTSFAYQWQSSTDGISWINIGGWATSTYLPTFDICNAKIRVTVAAINATDTATVTSASVEGFLPPSAPTTLPILNDTSTVGATFTVTRGIWPSTTNGTFQTYQWERSADGGASWSIIAGATGTSYLTVAGDVGYRIRVRETLTTNTGSSSVYTLTSPNLVT